MVEPPLRHDARPEAPDDSRSARARLRRRARRVLRTARPAAPPAAGGAARDRRHPDRADRRPVPPGHPRSRPQSGGRLPRHGEPAGAAQGADAAAARRRRRTAGRIPGPSWSGGCSSISRSARSRSGWDGPRSAGRSSSPAATCRRRRRGPAAAAHAGPDRAARRPSSGSSPRSRRRCCTAWSPGRSTSKRRPAGSRTCSEQRDEFGWLEALGPRPTIVDVLSTLLALLELAKRGVIRLTQPAPFSPMVIARDPARPAA